MCGSFVHTYIPHIEFQVVLFLIKETDYWYIVLFKVWVLLINLFSDQSLIYILGGFSGHIGHDPHLLYTLYAVQILVIEDALDVVNVDKIVECKKIH